MPSRRSTITGVGVGLAAAGAAAAAGVIAERITRGGDLDKGTIGPYDWVPGDETVSIAGGGIPLHVEIDEPDGPPDPTRPTVVMAHGFTLCLREWVLQRQALVDAGYRVVLFDHRSHGQSGHSSGRMCTIDQLGSDLKQVIDDHAADGPLVLIGHSMGGMAIMALGDQHPELIRDRVQAVAFVASSAGGGDLLNFGFGSMVGGLVGRFGAGVLWRLGRYQGPFDALRRVSKGVENAIVVRYSFDSPMSDEAVEFVGDMILSTPLSVMGDFLPALEKHDKRAALAAFSGTETLVLNGEGDRLLPPEHSDEIVRLIPGAEHVVMQQANHMLMLEHPVVVSEQLLALIDRGRRASAQAPTRKQPRVRRLLTDVTRLRGPAKPPKQKPTSTASKSDKASKGSKAAPAKNTKSARSGRRSSPEKP